MVHKGTGHANLPFRWPVRRKMKPIAAVAVIIKTQLSEVWPIITSRPPAWRVDLNTRTILKKT